MSATEDPQQTTDRRSRHFLLVGWAGRRLENLRSHLRGRSGLTQIEHEQLPAADVAAGDVVYAVAYRRRRLGLIGRLIVGDTRAAAAYAAAPLTSCDLEREVPHPV